MKTTNIKILGMFIGVILIIYGMFNMFSYSPRDVFIGIAFVLYGIGTMMTATQRRLLVKVGIAINFVTLILSLAAAIYERFIS